MNLKDLFSKETLNEVATFTAVTNADFKKWNDTITDMVDQGEDFEEALDLMLDNDPKYETLPSTQKKSIATKIRKNYYDSNH